MQYDKFVSNLCEFGYLDYKQNVAIALSGGVDSMALTLMAKKYFQKMGGCIIAIIIDHNLRIESASESLNTANICKSLDINHRILHWHKGSTSGNTQELARIGRYELLADFCAQNDILNCLIGTQMDDFAENFLIRLSKGSGIFGLSESYIHFFRNIRFCKPLFNFRKSECVQYLEQMGVAHIEDASNRTNKYYRNSIRSAIASISAENNAHFVPRVIESQQHIRHASELIKTKITQELLDHCYISSFGFAVLNLRIDSAVQYYVIDYLLNIIGGNTKSTRASKIKQLIDKIYSSNFQKTTLHGCIISSFQDNSIVIMREYSYIEDNSYDHTTGIWDNRFKIRNIALDYKVCKPNAEQIKQMQKSINLGKHTKYILAAMPIITHLENIVSIPHINYYNQSASDIIVSFEPTFVSRAVCSI